VKVACFVQESAHGIVRLEVKTEQLNRSQYGWRLERLRGKKILVTDIFRRDTSKPRQKPAIDSNGLAGGVTRHRHTQKGNHGVLLPASPMRFMGVRLRMPSRFSGLAPATRWRL